MGDTEPETLRARLPGNPGRAWRWNSPVGAHLCPLVAGLSIAAGPEPTTHPALGSVTSGCFSKRAFLQFYSAAGIGDVVLRLITNE